MNRVSESTKHKILDVVLELATARYPNARGHLGLMQKIALDDFGIRITKDRHRYWNKGINKDERKFMMFLLTHGG